MSFICGSRSLPREDDFDELWGASPCSSPSRKSKRNSFSARNNKNPYANRGLDKFSALLADLDHKKQKIFTQKGAEDISFVRFVYSDDKQYKPIIVKAKDRKSQLRHGVESPKRRDTEITELPTELQKSPEIRAANSMEVDKSVKEKKTSFAWKNIIKMEYWRRPSYYLPLFVIIIMLFLALFGRSFAILCTSIGWYVIPTINKSEEEPKKIKKKDYTRKYSEKITSPTSVLNGLMNDDPRRRSF